MSLDIRTHFDVSLGGHLQVLYRQRFIIALVAISAGLSSFVVSKMIEPRYEAVVEFYLPETSTRGGQSETELPIAPVPSGNRDGVVASISLLRTAEIRNRAAKIVTEKSAAEMELDVDPVVDRSSMVLLYVRDRDPEVAARVANAYFAVYNDFLDEIQKRRLQASLEQFTERLAKLDETIGQVANSNRDDTERLLELRSSLATAQQSLERQGLQAGPAAIMASTAMPPLYPVFPVVTLNVIIALIAGLVLGILYAVLLEHFRRIARARRIEKLEQIDWLSKLVDQVVTRSRADS